jgi:hypothetical protein
MFVRFSKAVVSVGAVLSLLTVSVPICPADQGSLADIYRTGKVRFVPEMVIDGQSLPEGVLFVGPVDIALDPSGHVFILDFQDQNIKTFDASGRFLKVIGRKGQGPGEFNMPLSFAFAKDRLAVWDMGNRRLCVLTPEGELFKAEGISGLSGRPQRIKTLPGGDLVIETEKMFFDDPKKPQEVALEILTSELTPKRVIYSHPVWRNKFMRLEQGLVNLPQPFAPDIHWDVSTDGKIVVGFSETYEMDIYGAEGKVLAKFTHPYDPVKVTAEDKKGFFDAMTHTTGEGTRQGAPDFVIKNTTFPAEKPAFNDILMDSEGNTWVHPFVKNQDLEKRCFDVFAPTGEFIDRVEILGESSHYPYRAKVIGGYLWTIETDEEGYFKIIKNKITR